MITYLRWRPGEERRTPPDQFEPLTAEHPMIGTVCCECGEELQPGQRPALFAVGPDSMANAAQHERGRWVATLAVGAHQDCLWPHEERT